MTAFSMLYLRLQPDLKDRIVAVARRDGVSANEWAQETLRRALASGADGSVSAGLAVSSAPVASDEPEPFPLVPKLYADEAHTRYPPPKPAETAAAAAGPGRDDDQATSGERPGSASASPFVPDALKPSVETPAEVAKAVAASVPGVTFAHSLAGPAKPLSKQEQAGRKK